MDLSERHRHTELGPATDPLLVDFTCPTAFWWEGQGEFTFAKGKK
ncbi:MAG TPA: hypothetical protein VM510_09830 [Caulifigura sp.]|jgi:hypothetical protein|nr:hypothetical protein [Caulifigura sp.]